MVGKFSYLGQTKFSPHSMSVPVYYGGQGGQPLRMAGWANWKPGWANENFFRRFATNFIKQNCSPWP